MEEPIAVFVAKGVPVCKLMQNVIARLLGLVALTVGFLPEEVFHSGYELIGKADAVERIELVEAVYYAFHLESFEGCLDDPDVFGRLECEVVDFFSVDILRSMVKTIGFGAKKYFALVMIEIVIYVMFENHGESPCLI